MFVLGCKNYYDYSSTIPKSIPYGLCMRGWLHQMEVWSVDATWGAVWTSEADRESKISGFVNCGGSFCNSRYTTVTTRGDPSPLTSLLFDSATFPITQTSVFVWDSSLGTITNQIMRDTTNYF